MTDKCVCHINGYELKDAYARKTVDEVKAVAPTRKVVFNNDSIVVYPSSNPFVKGGTVKWDYAEFMPETTKYCRLRFYVWLRDVLDSWVGMFEVPVFTTGERVAGMTGTPKTCAHLHYNSQKVIVTFTYSVGGRAYILRFYDYDGNEITDSIRIQRIEVEY